MTDRPVSKKYKRKVLLRKAIFWLLGFALFFVLGRLIIGLTDSSVLASRLIIAKPELRSIQTGFRATGTVRSSNTKTLIAPFSCSIEKVKINSGENVTSNTVVMELSTNDLEEKLIQLNDEKLLMVQKKAQLQKDLRYLYKNNNLNKQYDSIQLGNLETELLQLRQLHKIGGTPYEGVKQAEMKLQMFRIENMKSELELSKKLQDKAFEIDQLQIKVRLHDQEIEQVKNNIQLAMLTVPYSGVIQKINVSTGENVSQGMPLATVASSDQLEIKCETGATYGDELFVGQLANIKYGTKNCKGKVVQIDQTLNNDNIRFLVMPDSTAGLKLNQSVQVQIITRMKDSVWCIPKRNYYSGPGTYSLFIKRNNEAVKENVRLGLSNFEFVEVVSNRFKHEEIIIEGIPEHIKSNSFTLKY